MKSSLRSKFEIDSWDSQSKKTRVEYAEELISLVKELNIQLDESELMLKIGRHFEDEVSRTIRLQGIKSTGMLYDLLQEYDKSDEKKKGALKKQVQNNNNNNNFNKKLPEESQNKSGSFQNNQKPYRNFQKSENSGNQNVTHQEKTEQQKGYQKRIDSQDFWHNKSAKNQSFESWKSKNQAQKQKEITISTIQLTQALQSALENVGKKTQPPPEASKTDLELENSKERH